MYTMQNAIDEQFAGPKAKSWVREAFNDGFTDGMNLKRFRDYDGVMGQAYDRGYEVGLSEKRRYQWGDDPKVGKN